MIFCIGSSNFNFDNCVVVAQILFSKYVNNYSPLASIESLFAGMYGFMTDISVLIIYPLLCVGCFNPILELLFHDMSYIFKFLIFYFINF